MRFHRGVRGFILVVSSWFMFGFVSVFVVSLPFFAAPSSAGGYINFVVVSSWFRVVSSWFGVVSSWPFLVSSCLLRFHLVFPWFHRCFCGFIAFLVVPPWFS